MSIDLEDYTYYVRKDGKRDKVYAHYCEQCNRKKGYFAKSIKAKSCNSCAMKQKMAGHPREYRKDLAKKATSSRKNTKRSEECKKKISKANTGKLRSLNKRIAISCGKQGITLEQWVDFEYNKDDPKRCKYKSDKFCLQVYIRANYTCDLCGKRGDKLNAHHLNNWKQFIEQRYDLDNIVCLCIKCHRYFHSIYGNKNNTKEQYLELKECKHGNELDAKID